MLRAGAKKRTRHDDDERREVARRLRGLDYSDLQESLICAYLEALGIEGYADWVGIAHRIADLIEPSEPKVKCVAEVKVDGEQLEKLVHDAVVEYTGIDRDALLALADEMKRMPQCELCPAEIVDCSAHPDGCSDALIDYYARRIREALGVSDGGRVRHDIVTHRAPVLAADGMPLEVGQTVYAKNYGYVKCTVLAIEWVVDGYLVEVENEGGHKFRQTPDEFTHQRPDSWERIEEDVELSPADYISKYGRKTKLYAYEEVPRDLVRRAKKLAGVE